MELNISVQMVVWQNFRRNNNMGLDMYLEARRFFIKENKKLKAQFSVKMKPFPLKEVRFEVGYWRKANQIHNWFVENVQDGNDDCKEYDVSEEQLKELLELCKVVLADPGQARDLLPTREGFFFGETAYNEFYFKDLEDTIEIIQKIFDNIDLKKYDIMYSSSW